MAAPTNICTPALVLPQGDGLELWHHVDLERELTARAWRRERWREILIYDAADFHWPVIGAKPFHLPLLARICGPLGYNPSLAVELRLGAPEHYELSVLQQAIVRRADESAQGLSQMIERERLKILVLGATSFSDLIVRLKKYRVV